MKNSLFKRVAAAAAAVPLALTQCLTFSSVAAENDAVQVEGNNIQAESGKEISIASLLRIEPDKTVSVWNDKVTEALVQNIGTKGTFDASDYADKIAEKSGREIAKKGDAYYNRTYNNNDDAEIYAVPKYLQSDTITPTDKGENAHDFFILKIEWDSEAAETNFTKWNKAENNKETDMIYITASRGTS